MVGALVHPLHADSATCVVMKASETKVLIDNTRLISMSDQHVWLSRYGPLGVYSIHYHKFLIEVCRVFLRFSYSFLIYLNPKSDINAHRHHTTSKNEFRLFLVSSPQLPFWLQV